MSQENVEMLRAAVEAFNRRDLDGLRAVLAPDVQIVPMRAALEDTMYSGPDAAKQWFTAVEDSWENMSAEVHEWRDVGERVLALGRFRGRGRVSGADLDADAAAVARFRDGRIARLRIYTNVGDALKDAGLSE
jgi:ketosteroid isomerase-like protein